FENYVSEAASYISPLSRNEMMRLSRIYISASLHQMEMGVEGNIHSGLQRILQEPNTLLYELLEDLNDAEQDASDYNKRQLERIEDSIQSTQSVKKWMTYGNYIMTKLNRLKTPMTHTKNWLLMSKMITLASLKV